MKYHASLPQGNEKRGLRKKSLHPLDLPVNAAPALTVYCHRYHGRTVADSHGGRVTVQPDMGPVDLRHRRLVHVSGRSIVTASAVPERLHVLSEAAFGAWCDLYKTREPRFYAAFMEAVSHGNRA
jgi:hypothetical protein